MKFIIINKTKFSTRDLRAFVVRSYRVAKDCVGPSRAAVLERSRREIRIRFARSNWRGKNGSTGHAYFYGSAHVGLGDEVTKRELAYVTAHEFGHVFGVDHGDMSGGPLMRQDSTLYKWADSLPLRAKAVKKPTATERSQQRRAALVARLSKWEAKERRAKNAIKRIRLRLRAYDRRSAAPAETQAAQA